MRMHNEGQRPYHAIPTSRNAFLRLPLASVGTAVRSAICLKARPGRDILQIASAKSERQQQLECTCIILQSCSINWRSLRALNRCHLLHLRWPRWQGRSSLNTRSHSQHHITTYFNSHILFACLKWHAYFHILASITPSVRPSAWASCCLFLPPRRWLGMSLSRVHTM